MDDRPTGVAAVEAPSMIERVTQHFALISTLATLTAILSSTAFLYGYLSVFDWHLIWIIEYSDVLKFGLVVFAVSTGFVGLLGSYLDDAYNFFNMDKERRSWWIKSVILLLFLSFVPKIWGDETGKEHFFTLHIMSLLSVLIAIGLAFLVSYHVANRTVITGRLLYSFGCLWIAVLFLFGLTFGDYTRDTPGFKHTVVLKGTEMTNVGVVMITSHHTVLYTQEGDVIVAPTADVSPIILKHE